MIAMLEVVACFVKKVLVSFQNCEVSISLYMRLPEWTNDL